MKNLFQTWTLSRFLYLAAGIFFVLIAANDRVWFMIPFRLYFMAWLFSNLVVLLVPVKFHKKRKENNLTKILVEQILLTI